MTYFDRAGGPWSPRPPPPPICYYTGPWAPWSPDLTSRPPSLAIYCLRLAIKNQTPILIKIKTEIFQNII